MHMGIPHHASAPGGPSFDVTARLSDRQVSDVVASASIFCGTVRPLQHQPLSMLTRLLAHHLVHLSPDEKYFFLLTVGQFDPDLGRRFQSFARLVGIEPNPGPNPPVSEKMKRRLQAAKAALKVAVAIAPKGKATTKKITQRKAGSSGSSLAARYLQVLRAPFLYGGVRVGCGNMSVTGLKRSRFRDSLTVDQGTTQSSGVIILAPNSFVTGNAWNASSGTLTAFLSWGFSNTTSAALSSGTYVAGTNQFGNAPANGTQIAASIDSSRVVAAGLRVRLKVPATSLAGSIYAGQITTAFLELAGKSPDAIQQLPGMQMISTSDDSCVSTEVQFRPTDASDYQFSTPSNSTLQPLLVVVWKNFPATGVKAYTLDVEAVSHVETLAGVDQDDGDEEVTAADGGMSLDIAQRTSLQAMVNTFPTFVDSLAQGLKYASAVSFGRHAATARARGG